MIFFQAILPLFALVGAGYLLGRWRGTKPEPLTDVCLYILIPVLMFASLVRNPLSGLAFLQIFGWVFGQVFIYWGGVWLVGRLLGWDRSTRSAITLSLSTINAASYGLTVSLFAFGDRALSAASLLVVCNNLNYSSFGVYFAAGGRRSPLASLLSVFKLPLIYTVILALTITALGIHLPERLLDITLLVGKAGPQVAMIILGIQFATLKFRRAGSSELYAGIFAKSILAPALGIGLTFLLGAEGIVRDVLLVSSCLPTAISALLLSVRLNARPDLVGGIIFGSILISPITITAVLFWIGP